MSAWVQQAMGALAVAFWQAGGCGSHTSPDQTPLAAGGTRVSSTTWRRSMHSGRSTAGGSRNYLCQLTAGDGGVLQQLAARHLGVDHGIPVGLPRGV